MHNMNKSCKNHLSWRLSHFVSKICSRFSGNSYQILIPSLQELETRVQQNFSNSLGQSRGRHQVITQSDIWPWHNTSTPQQWRRERQYLMNGITCWTAFRLLLDTWYITVRLLVLLEPALIINNSFCRLAWYEMFEGVMQIDKLWFILVNNQIPYD